MAEKGDANSKRGKPMDVLQMEYCLDVLDKTFSDCKKFISKIDMKVQGNRDRLIQLDSAMQQMLQDSEPKERDYGDASDGPNRKPKMRK